MQIYPLENLQWFYQHMACPQSQLPTRRVSHSLHGILGLAAEHQLSAGVLGQFRRQGLGPFLLYAEWPGGLRATVQDVMDLASEDQSVLNQCRDLFKQLNQQIEELHEQAGTVFSNVVDESKTCEANMWAEEARVKAATFFVAASLPHELMKGRVGDKGEQKDLLPPAFDKVRQKKQFCVKSCRSVHARSSSLPTISILSTRLWISMPCIVLTKILMALSRKSWWRRPSGS